MNPEITKKRGEAFALVRTLGYTGEDAVEFLHAAAQVSSLDRLTLTDWKTLNTHLRAKVTAADKPTNVTEAQWKAVWKLRRELRMDDKHFRNTVKHVTKLDDPRWLDAASGRALIAGLNRIKASRTAKRLGAVRK